MRLLANENVPALLVESLINRGHDVAWIKRDSPGATDAEVLRRSVSERRVLITFDKDFGDLVFRLGANASSGVILLRLRGATPDALADACVRAIDCREDWVGHLSVIEPGRIRMVPLSRSI